MRSHRGWSVLIAIVVMGYAVVRAAPAAEVFPGFREVLIDADPPTKPYYKLAGDLTGDGRPEIVIGGAKGPLVMYSGPQWEKSVVAESGYDGGVNGELADVNGDGRQDIVMGSIVWFENPAAAGGEWIVHRIDREPIHDVEAADLDGDGRLDIVCRDQSAFGNNGHRVFVYHQRGPDDWSKDVISCPHGEGLKVADVDGDARPDIIIGGLWFHQHAGRWNEHTFAPDWTEPDTKVDTGDLNGDGRLDIVLTPSELKGEQYHLSWFEAPEDRTQPWRERVLVPEIECVIHSLAVADFNGDGRPDVAAAEMHQGADPDDVFVLFNPGGEGIWERQVISTSGSHDLLACDLDGDGDMDLLGANHAGTHPVILWENQHQR